MSLIQVSHLTFAYDGSFDNIFEDVSFSVDTDWRLGLIGRNGRGKTTLLRLLQGELPSGGAVSAPTRFAYFPFQVADEGAAALDVARESVAPFKRWEAQMEALLHQGDMAGYGDIQEQYQSAGGYEIDGLLEREAGKLGVAARVLGRPFASLSGGEKTKVLIAALFLRKDTFCLIDEPTNHLDAQGRRLLAEYLSGKRGFLLVSHDRAFLDRTVDHTLSIGRGSIQVQRGNYSVWQHNKALQDGFELQENARLKKDIGRLRQAARQKAAWSQKTEDSKIGGHAADRGFIGHRAAKMMKRSKAIEQRLERAAEEKEALLGDLERADPLKLAPLPAEKKRLLEVRGLAIDYGQGPLFAPLSFTVEEGERVALAGKNGCGKSSILRLCCGQEVPHTGTLTVAGGTVCSYVPQDTAFLCGDLRAWVQREGLDESLYKAILRKLDFPRAQFLKEMASFSEGQKKKVLLARSLARPAHLYLWDEPLNYVDILSRSQLEALLLTFRPTMVFVEHDGMFAARIATRTVEIG